MKTTVEAVKSVLVESGLENAGAGVIFPWGAKIVELDGKKMLQPMTPEEYRHAVHEETGKMLSEEQILPPACALAEGSCVSQGCSQAGGTCHIYSGHGYFYCLCEY